MARRDKYGILPPPPVKRGTVVKLRSGRNGTLTNIKAIVMRNVPASDFSRAYGRQVVVCVVRSRGRGRDVDVSEKGAHDLYPVGVTKKIPKVCREAVAAEYGPSKRRR